MIFKVKLGSKTALKLNFQTSNTLKAILLPIFPCKNTKHQLFSCLTTAFSSVKNDCLLKQFML